jgi:hypothetical protein
MAISVTPHVQRMGDVPFSVVRGPPGSNVAERLAGLIEGWDRWQRCIWLRSPKAGRDALAGPLASACRHRWVDAAELAGRLTVDVGRLVESIRPVLADRGVSLVAVTESRHPLAFRRGADHVVPAADLAGPNGIEAFGGLPERYRNRRLELGGRRATVVRDVLEAAAAWPRDAADVYTPASCSLASVAGPMPFSSRKLARTSLIWRRTSQVWIRRAKRRCAVS